MKFHSYLLVLLFLNFNVTKNKNLKYLKQVPPSNTPEKFAPGLISTSNEYEFGSIFNKEGTEFYYGVSIKGKGEIRYTKLEGEEWTTPKTIFVHPKYGYNDPFLSNDEKRLYFISTQSLDGKGDSKDYDIWFAEKTKEGWSKPINAGNKINSKLDEYYISFSHDNTMYFSSNKLGNNFDIQTSKMVDGQFQNTEVLPKAINTLHYEGDVFIAPDESYIIFCATRPDGMGRGDMYISFKKDNGSWSNSINMGNTLNTKGHELCPFVSKDGKYFFYTSNKDIYWVSTDVFEKYKKL